MRLTLIAAMMTLMLSGCSGTWEGAKKDSSNIWDKTKQTTNDAIQSTKEAIHEATE